jgi:hypothetical protein
MVGLFKKKFDIEAFISGSVEALRLATEAHAKTWHFGEEHSWDVNQDEGQIVFSFDEGIIATAPVQIIGTFNANDETFMWGWDHPSIKDELQINATRVKSFGKKNGSKELATQKVSCTEERAWEFTDSIRDRPRFLIYLRILVEDYLLKPVNN